MQGTFIVFEGGEGSGKTTVSRAIADLLRAEHLPVLQTREPGGSPFAEDIRKIILSDGAKHADAETLFALFVAARRDHCVQTIVPALASGTHVLSDRFMASTWAYQIVAQKNDQLRSLFHDVHQLFVGALSPHYIFFDVPPEVGLARAKSRPEATTHFDERDIAFHTDVREGFHQFFSLLPPSQVTVIDATMPLEQVQARAREVVLDIIQN